MLSTLVVLTSGSATKFLQRQPHHRRCWFPSFCIDDENIVWLPPSLFTMVPCHASLFDTHAETVIFDTHAETVLPAPMLTSALFNRVHCFASVMSDALLQLNCTSNWWPPPGRRRSGKRRGRRIALWKRLAQSAGTISTGEGRSSITGNVHRLKDTTDIFGRQ